MPPLARFSESLRTLCEFKRLTEGGQVMAGVKEEDRCVCPR